jgi:hypothetical protein
VNGFIEKFYTPLGTTSNYSSTANRHNSQITTVPAKPFPACCVFISRSLALASNSGDSSALRAQLPSSQILVQNSLGRPMCLQDLLCTDHVEVLRFQQYLYCCALIQCCGNVFTESLPRNVSDIFAYLALTHSNCSTRYIIIICVINTIIVKIISIITD